jgi:large subunit ribosomal protein L18e
MFMEGIEKTQIRKWIESLEKAKAGSKNPKLLSYLIKLSSKPKRQRVSVNLDKLNRYANEKDSIIVPGKVLGYGKISKSIRITAIDFSGSAVEKLKTAKCDIVDINDMLSGKPARIII